MLKLKKPSPLHNVWGKWYTLQSVRRLDLLIDRVCLFLSDEMGHIMNALKYTENGEIMEHNENIIKEDSFSQICRNIYAGVISVAILAILVVFPLYYRIIILIFWSQNISFII